MPKDPAKPCNECPFLKQGTSVGLGTKEGVTVDTYLGQLAAGMYLPCHKQYPPDVEEAESTEQRNQVLLRVPRCAGAAMMRSHADLRPYLTDTVYVLPADDSTIFSDLAAFYRHYTGTSATEAAAAVAPANLLAAAEKELTDPAVTVAHEDRYYLQLPRRQGNEELLTLKLQEDGSLVDICRLVPAAEHSQMFANVVAELRERLKNALDQGLALFVLISNPGFEAGLVTMSTKFVEQQLLNPADLRPKTIYIVSEDFRRQFDDRIRRIAADAKLALLRKAVNGSTES